MTQVVNDGEFWLPPHFLTEDNVVMKMNNAVGSGAVWRNQADVKLDVPRKEFPYEFGFRSEVSSPVESLDNTESEEEDFFAELTQRLTLSESRKVSPLDLYKPAPEVCCRFFFNKIGIFADLLVEEKQKRKRTTLILCFFDGVGSKGV
ncbi:unnamed protein product [Rhodiola kirilowii]